MRVRVWWRVWEREVCTRRAGFEEGVVAKSWCRSRFVADERGAVAVAAPATAWWIVEDG